MAASPAAPVSAGIATVRLEGGGNRWQARVDNHLPGPVQVVLRAGGFLQPGEVIKPVAPRN